LSRWADCIFLGNLKAEKYLNHAATIYTGNPLSEKILQLNKNFEPGEIGLKPDTKKIFLVGGSQGSFFLNKMLAAIAKDLLNKGIEIIWQTGSYSHKHFYNRFSTTRGIYIFDYSHQIAELYKICDLVIARAGALSLAELETLRIPSLLVPLPTAAENHQYYNALELKEKRVAEIIEQKDLTPEKLFRNICLMLEKLDDYKTNFGSSPHGEAALKIASYINNHTGGKA
jgi:UDP-N-acetylglucosamine--N-acetylmuramyl-(pentapeptide) pyrophosphoryl-undecaprenol N-acetylglucosamine transferase